MKAFSGKSKANGGTIKLIPTEHDRASKFYILHLK